MRIIIKVGSNTLVKDNHKININNIDKIISIINDLRNDGHEVLLVTSGAVAFGMNKLNLDMKPKDISLKQACAAVGQVSLMATYENECAKYNFSCAQILLCQDDFESRVRMLNMTNTIEELFKNKVLPIVNENDALAVEEIKVGDNDTLSSQLVPMINAKILILVSDIDGLYDKNPKEYKDAKLIEVVEDINEDLYKMVGDKITSYGTGGMTTKLNAASIATNAGARMYIVSEKNLDNIKKACDGTFKGTLFKEKEKRIASRMHWLIFKTKSNGDIIVDEGAKDAILKHTSLLPIGIVDVYGDFLKDSVVYIKDKNNNILAKGITNYNSEEIKEIKGLKLNEVKKIIKDKRKEEVVHASDLIIYEGVDYDKFKY